MDSILNWYKEEGFIFKGGSGAGLNLSRIRSSKELLSSGGTASGPVSFMRGADASAGTIKSGGATRRAAKMVVLDVDHPDIEEFVRPRRARRTRSARCVTPASTWTSAAPTSPRCSTRTPTTRSASATSSCARSRTAPTFGLRAPQDRRGHRGGRRPRAVPQDRDGRVGVRRPGPAVRRHDQRLAHQPGDRPDHRVQPVLGVHVARQLLVQPGVAEPAEVPQGRRHLRRARCSPRPSSSSSPRWTSRSASRTSRPSRSATPPATTASSASATPTSARC